MQIEIFKKFTSEIADMCGEYIRKEFGKRHAVDSKKDNSPVTVVDRTVESMIRDAVQKKFPDHGIIGEEFGNTNEKAEFKWVIDPIDGTKSFITGVPLFGTLIALTQNGLPILGVIDQPILRERCLGDNKECLFNGVRTRVCDDQKTLRGAIALTSDVRYPKDLHSAEGWNKFEKSVFFLRTWGDCYGYMLICRGLAHVMVDAQLEIWDLMALLPCLRGAGAFYSDWNGKEKFGKDGLITACSKDLFDETLNTLNNK